MTKDVAYTKAALPTGLEGLICQRYKLCKQAVAAQATLAITDNWQAVGGADQYVKWCGGSGHSDFFSNSNCMQLYKNFASTLINRVNTVNGRVCAPGQYTHNRAAHHLGLALIMLLRMCLTCLCPTSAQQNALTRWVCSAGTGTIPASLPGISSMSQDVRSEH